MAYKMDRYMEDLVVKLIGVHSLHHFQLVPMLEWCTTTIPTISKADSSRISIDLKYLMKEQILSSLLDQSQHHYPKRGRRSLGRHIRSCRRSSKQEGLRV